MPWDFNRNPNNLHGVGKKYMLPRHDLLKMAELELYPNASDELDMKSYLLDFFKSVQDIYAIAAKNNQAIITFLS